LIRRTGLLALSGLALVVALAGLVAHHAADHRAADGTKYPPF
jgi:hypothetical protein